MIKTAKQYGYNLIILSANRTASTGRYKGGTMIFVRNKFQVSGIIKERHEWGEHVEFILNKQYKFYVVYRNPASNPSDMTHIFTETLNSNMPIYYFGDFNWQ